MYDKILKTYLGIGPISDHRQISGPSKENRGGQDGEADHGDDEIDGIALGRRGESAGYKANVNQS